jgi:hypothetical protein
MLPEYNTTCQQHSSTKQLCAYPALTPHTRSSLESDWSVLEWRITPLMLRPTAADRMTHATLHSHTSHMAAYIHTLISSGDS